MMDTTSGRRNNGTHDLQLPHIEEELLNTYTSFQLGFAPTTVETKTLNVKTLEMWRCPDGH